MDDVRGDVLRPPHGTTPAAVKSNKNQNLIKCLTEIQQSCINLLSSVQSTCEVIYSGDELSLTRSLLPEAMLVIAQNLAVLQKLHMLTMHYVFRVFAVTRCQ